MSDTVAPPLQTDTCDVFHADPAKVAEIRAALPGGAELATLAETFRALGDPTSVRLLTALAQTELGVCDLAALAGSSESATSHQLRLLRSLRIVRARRDGRMMYYRLDDDHIVKLLAQGVAHVAEAAGRRAR